MFCCRGGQRSGNRQFVVLGVTVDATSVSAWRDEDDAPITEQAFWTAVGIGGVLVDIKGTETGNAALQAHELQLELE
jgi:hypothetical protein